jgi:hypothetical protein
MSRTRYIERCEFAVSPTFDKMVVENMFYHFFYSSSLQLAVQIRQQIMAGAYRKGGLGGSNPPFPKFRSFAKTEPDSQFHGIYIRNNLIRIWVSFICKLLTTGWTVRGSNPGGGEIFRTRPDRPWGPPNLLYNGYRVFPGGKAAGAWC